MPKHVLDVGNCVPDHAAIRELVEDNFDAVVHQAHAAPDSIDALAQQDIDLVLINRKLDCDYSDGLEIVRQIKSHPTFRVVPVMMVTNYEDQQQLAVAAGAERGFGKLEIGTPATVELLAEFLR